MIVADTNLIVYFYISGEYTELATQVFAQDPVWTAPYLWRSEFRNTSLLYLRKGLLTLPQLLQINEAAEMMMHDNEFHVPTSEILQLASVTDCSAYDCEFVALAQEFGVPLVTADKKVLSAFPNVALSLAQFVA
jgi:predicted nucleic acid-binding protein